MRDERPEARAASAKDDARVPRPGVLGAVVAKCARCSDVGSIAALIHARAGDYAGANALLDEVARALDEEAVAELRKSLATARGFATMAASAPEGPLREHARARELGALEAWGRAYLVLAPYVDAIEKAPGYALGFAELAWRAGAVDVADRVLRANVPAAQIEPLKLEWSTKMGWIDDESGAAR